MYQESIDKSNGIAPSKQKVLHLQKKIRATSKMLYEFFAFWTTLEWRSIKALKKVQHTTGLKRP